MGIIFGTFSFGRNYVLKSKQLCCSSPVIDFVFRTRIPIWQSLVGIVLDWISQILLFHFVDLDIEV